uniref:Uncharacterized protein n=1 Tax=Lotharella globosa TaxID=91324 RepID=A0A7S4DW93_9EUKA
MNIVFHLFFVTRDRYNVLTWSMCNLLGLNPHEKQERLGCTARCMMAVLSALVRFSSVVVLSCRSHCVRACGYRVYTHVRVCIVYVFVGFFVVFHVNRKKIKKSFCNQRSIEPKICQKE